MTSPSLHTLVQRIAALEGRLSDIEGGYGRTIYQMSRRLVRVEMDLNKLLSHFSLAPTTEDEVDAVLDEES